MAGLWDAVLPVIQEINSYGGNFMSAFTCRAVIDEIDHLAEAGDIAMKSKHNRLEELLRKGDWPTDHDAFKSIFETYHEALFYILACRRSVQLEHIPEVHHPTPDFRTTSTPIEQFEVKTIDFSGGTRAHRINMEEGLDANVDAAEEAHRTGFGMRARVISPQGDATDSLEAIDRAMAQIGGNVKAKQFNEYPTFLVLPMIRTALRTSAEELCPRRFDGAHGGKVSGHLWTIAAHDCGAEFYDSTPERKAHCLGDLKRAGILWDYPFIRGIIFLHTQWSSLPGSDSYEPFPDPAFGFFGIWNSTYCPPPGVSLTDPASSVFAKICNEWKPSRM